MAVGEYILLVTRGLSRKVIGLLLLYKVPPSGGNLSLKVGRSHVVLNLMNLENALAPTEIR